MNKLFKFLIVFVLVAVLFCFGMNAFASLHTKWSAGDLVFYDGETDIFSIRSGTSGVKIFDDIKLTFGTDNDATIEYDEDGTNKLILTCNNGFTIAGVVNFTSAVSISGGDVTFMGDIANSSFVWDESANTVKLFTTYTADAQIETYDARIDVTTTYDTAITTGKFAQGVYIGVYGTGNVDSGGFLFPLWIDSSGTGTNNGTYWMTRYSVQAGGLLPNAYIQFQTASPGVEHLFEVEGNVAPYATGGTDCTDSGATDPIGNLAIQVPGGTTAYIRVWTDK